MLAYSSLQTVGNLLLTNSDFRVFLSDLNTIGREVFKDSAFTLSKVAEDAGKKLEPSQQEQQALKKPGQDGEHVPSKDELNKEFSEATDIVANGASKIVKDAEQSLEEKMTGEEKDSLIFRLKKAVQTLRKRPDYNESVSTISTLVQRLALLYSRAAEEVADVAQDDVQENAASDRALQNFWALLRSFGDTKQWDELEARFKKVMDHRKKDPDFENLMNDAGNSLLQLLTDPDFIEHADEKFHELRQKSKGVGSDSPLKQDVDAVFEQAQITFQSVLNDQDVARLIKSTMQLAHVLSPAGNYINTDLVSDSINVFVPLLIAAVQYIPIPRLEVSTPDIDMLLENLIIEPGRTVNQSSFLPYKLRVETQNDLEIMKHKFRTTSSTKHLMTIKIDGMSMRADEVGFWLRAHHGLLRLADEGLASFHLDDRGVDVHFDVEIGKEKLEKILTLKAVRVHIHKLQYVLRKSKFSWLGWLIKPILRPIVRKVMEKQIATAIADFFHAANRELLFARERLRATRISDPDDLKTFIKAVMTRLTPEEDPDFYTRVGVEQPGKGVFKGVYAPGSVVKVWHEEAMQAAERVDEYEEGGWRNEIFDTHTQMLT